MKVHEMFSMFDFDTTDVQTFVFINDYGETRIFKDDPEDGDEFAGALESYELGKDGENAYLGSLKVYGWAVFVNDNAGYTGRITLRIDVGPHALYPKNYKGIRFSV